VEPKLGNEQDDAAEREDESGNTLAELAAERAAEQYQQMSEGKA
jgi:hypothetical protein